MRLSKLLPNLIAVSASLFLAGRLLAATPNDDVQQQIAYLKGRIAEEVTLAADPRRKAELVRNDDAWWTWQAARCSGKTRNPTACINETLALRRAVIDAQKEGPPPAISKYNSEANYTFPKNPPKDWWGLVFWSVEKRPPTTSFRSSLFLDKDGNLKIMTRSGLLVKWDINDTALIDAFTRHVEQTYASAPDLRDSEQRALSRLGLIAVHPTPGGGENADFGLRISSRLDVFAEDYGCMNLLSFYSWYWLHDVKEKTNEGRFWPEVLSIPGVHVFERFPTQETNEFFGRCEQTDRSTTTSDFLPMHIAFWGRFPDGTTLATLSSYRPHHEGEKYIVRFRPDLTSPFFYGWRRLFVIPDTMLPSSHRDETEVVKIIDSILDEAVKQQ